MKEKLVLIHENVNCHDRYIPVSSLVWGKIFGVIVSIVVVISTWLLHKCGRSMVQYFVTDVTFIGVYFTVMFWILFQMKEVCIEWDRKKVS